MNPKNTHYSTKTINSSVKPVERTDLRLARYRVDHLDLARGIAVSLMIISHTIKGLLMYEQMPPWGIMPIHTITKFSSSLFFVIFGMTLALFFTPYVGTRKWPQKKSGLLFRALEIMIWYKLLTIVQMYQTHPPRAILDTLLFKDFPDFVEVLGFYAFILLWIPFFLPLWRQMPSLLKVFTIVGFGYGGSIEIHSRQFILVACAEKFKVTEAADRALKEVGQAITDSGLLSL